MPSGQNMLFGELAIRNKMMTKEQLEVCLSIQKRMKELGALYEPIGRIAMNQGYLTPDKVNLILAIQGRPLEGGIEKEPIKPLGASRVASRKENILKQASYSISQRKKDIFHKEIQSRLRQKTTRAIALAFVLIGCLIFLIKFSPYLLKRPSHSHSSEKNQQHPRPLKLPAPPLKKPDPAKDALMFANKFKQKHPLEYEKVKEKYDYVVKNWPDSPWAVVARSNFSNFENEFLKEAEKRYNDITKEALNYENQDKLYKAYLLLRSYPEAFKITKWYFHIKQKSSNLIHKINQKFQKDIDYVDVLSKSGEIEKAKGLCRKIMEYGTPQMQMLATGKIKEIEKTQEMIRLAEKDKARAKLLNELFASLKKDDFIKALGLCENLLKHKNLDAMRKKIEEIKDGIEMLIIVLDAAKERIKQFKKDISFELKNGKGLKGEVIEIEDYKIRLKTKKGAKELLLQDISPTQLISLAKKILDLSKGSSHLFLLCFALRYDLTDIAQAEFNQAKKLGVKGLEKYEAKMRLLKKPFKIKPVR